MIAVLKRPGEAPELYETSGRIWAIGKELGGHVNSYRFASDACIFFRDDQKAEAQPFNVSLIGLDLYGPILITGIQDGMVCELRRAEQVLQWVAEKGQETK